MSGGDFGTVELGPWFTQDDGEEVLWSAHPRIQTVIPAALVGLVIAVGVVAMALFAAEMPILAVGGVFGVLPPLLTYLWVRNTQYVVTNQACYRKTGGLSRRVLAVEFDSVQNSSYEQGVLGNLFGYGTVTVDTAGGMGAELRFTNVDDPSRVRELVSKQRARTDEDGIPGSIDQWRAVRDEVRRLRRLTEQYEQHPGDR
ncbi:PH domain-containing protein [Haloarchaeobius sp. DFWS5]|uniref:PH domain-containing protein n=1 Tax=Haloarchaeobius sp. DFWS5 TaxID=3446114 RepID=UPI003EBAB2A8